MSRARKRKKEREVRPLSSAGIMSFYEDLNAGIKVRPHVIVALAIMFTLIVILLKFLVPL